MSIVITLILENALIREPVRSSLPNGVHLCFVRNEKMVSGFGIKRNHPLDKAALNCWTTRQSVVG